jgi:glycine betaine/proline transport system permease protein
MMALAMVVIASMIGARGLGLEVLLAISRIEVGRGFEAGISIVFLAIIIDRLTHALAARQEKMLTP